MPRKRKEPTDADLILEFIETLIKVPEGKLHSQPLKILPFQEKFIQDVYGRKKRPTRAIASFPRKAGKTTLSGCLLLAHLVGPVSRKNEQILVGARSRDQASIVFNLMCKMIEQEPMLQEITHIVPSSKRIIGLTTGSEIRCLAADGAKAMGLSGAVILLDELGQVVGPTDYFTDSLITSSAAHESPLTICISTQSPSDADLLSLWIDDIQSGNDPDGVCHLYCADADCDIMDEKQWHKANPALKSGFYNVEWYRKQMETAARLPSEQNKVMNLLLNMRTARESKWLAPTVVKENNTPPDWDVFREKGVHLSLDLALINDLCAAAIAAKDDDGFVHVHSYAFTPLGGITERSMRDRVPFDQWARDGIVYAPTGDTLNYDMIAEWLRIELERQEIPLRSVTFDRWKIREFRAAAERVGFAQDVEWSEIGQGFKDQSGCITHFETLLLERKLRLGSHPPLNLGMASAVIVSDPAGGRKLSKSKSSQKIDCLQAAIQAVYPLTQNEMSFDVEALIA